MLNWIVWNITDYLNENGFGVKKTYKGWYAIKPNQTALFGGGKYYSSVLPSRLGLWNTLTAPLQMGKSPNECPGYDTKQFWWWGSSVAGALGNAEHPFIAIAPKSTLTRRGSTW